MLEISWQQQTKLLLPVLSYQVQRCVCWGVPTIQRQFKVEFSEVSLLQHVIFNFFELSQNHQMTFANLFSQPIVKHSSVVAFRYATMRLMRLAQRENGVWWSAK